MITQKIIARTDSLKLDKIISRYGEDSMRQVVFIIVRPDPESEELIPITIPEDAVGSFRILKPSGNFVIVPMSKSVLATGETAFDVVLPASANTAKGSGYYDIRITSDSDKYYFTAQGDFIIDDNIISDEVLEDVSEVNGLIFPDDFLTIEDHVAYIDDDTISTDRTWSSNKINEEIDAHAGGDVSKTVSGNPVTFTDGASAPLVKCVTEIQGSQDLHGYDKPWVGGAGKNKAKQTVDGIKARNSGLTWVGNTTTVNNGTVTILTDNADNVIGYKFNGNFTQEFLFSVDDVSYVASENVIVSGCPSGSPAALEVWRSGSVIAQDTGSGVSVNAGSMALVIRVPNNASMSNLVYTPMIRLSTETDSTFAPYSNICPITAYNQSTISVEDENEVVQQTSTATFSQSIYQGNADFVGGKTRATWGYIASYNGETLPGEWISSMDVYAPGTTPTTGAQVAYELATPTTSSVTTTNLPIKSLSGYNHIESTTGDMEVEYITERFQPLIDSIKQL